MNDRIDEFVSIGFWKRFWAYMIDIIPIIVLVFSIFYFFLGFDEILASYLNNSQDNESRVKFLAERNKVRDISFFLWVLYGMIMDYSKFQGTHGKMILGVKVTDKNGNRITFLQSFLRMFIKIVGALPFFLGYIWAVFRKDKSTWHDLVSKTRVEIR